MGSLQGSILSVTLFSIKINSLANVLNDNFLICFRGNNMNIIKGQLQLCLIKIENLAIVNGFTFCSSKNCMICTFSTKEEPTKWLGLLFDSKLTFLPTIKMLQYTCLTALNIYQNVCPVQTGVRIARIYQIYIDRRFDQNWTTNVSFTVCCIYLHVLIRGQLIAVSYICAILTILIRN